MKRVVVATIVLTTALAGCRFFPTKEEAYALKAAAEVRDSMNDPTSVKLKDISVKADKDCMRGKILAKNGLGTYTGYRNFVWWNKTVYIEPERSGSKDISSLVDEINQSDRYFEASDKCPYFFPTVNDNLFSDI